MATIRDRHQELIVLLYTRALLLIGIRAYGVEDWG